MSGGSFNYAYTQISQFADELEVRLRDPNKVDEWGYTPNKFEDNTLKKLKDIQILAQYISELMKEVEWLYSGDTSDESFSERVSEIESKYKRSLSQVG